MGIPTKETKVMMCSGCHGYRSMSADRDTDSDTDSGCLTCGGSFEIPHEVRLLAILDSHNKHELIFSSSRSDDNSSPEYQIECKTCRMVVFGGHINWNFYDDIVKKVGTLTCPPIERDNAVENLSLIREAYQAYAAKTEGVSFGIHENHRDEYLALMELLCRL